MPKKHITSQHGYVVDDKGNREMESSRVFVYSALHDRMITWLFEADYYRRLTEKRLRRRFRIRQNVRILITVRVSLGGRYQVKQT